MADGIEQDIKDYKNAHNAVLRGPGDVAIQAKDSIVSGSGDFLDKVKARFTEGFNSVFDKSAKFDQEAQGSYTNRASIISAFAAEYRSGVITPETMKGMEYLKDAKALNETSSGRISSGLYDYVKENPLGFGLKQDSIQSYAGGKQDITLYSATAKI